MGIIGAADHYVADPPQKRRKPIRTEVQLRDWVAEMVAGYDPEWGHLPFLAATIVETVRQFDARKQSA